jgi:hypothetical protein
VGGTGWGANLADRGAEEAVDEVEDHCERHLAVEGRLLRAQQRPVSAITRTFLSEAQCAVRVGALTWA